ncbi:DUF6461 domain-containing protein [Kribbella sp. NPDC048928]|uniref:DUF6461 domain-containing protein n=1 Tax=Kribbella sp. NPDC048928 TaxID=3364111 RepID=UPI00371C826E
MTAEDYAWFEGTALSYAYCMTLVRGVGAAEALSRINGEVVDRSAGLTAFIKYAQDNSPWFGREDQRLVIGATELDGWTLLLESNGFLGVTTEVIQPLSDGTRVVSHYCNVDAEDRFCWMEDGELRVRFEPLFPYRRDGAEPDSLIEPMLDLGFDLRDNEDRNYDNHTAATFALTEHLTGIRITQELLDGANYLCALAPLPR